MELKLTATMNSMSTSTLRTVLVAHSPTLTFSLTSNGKLTKDKTHTLLKKLVLKNSFTNLLIPTDVLPL
jgi:hypothetical protein